MINSTEILGKWNLKHSQTMWMYINILHQLKPTKHEARIFLQMNWQFFVKIPFPNYLNFWFILLALHWYFIDKLSTGKTKCRSPVCIRTWWTVQECSLVNLLGVLKPSLRLDLIDPQSSFHFFLMLQCSLKQRYN